MDERTLVCIDQESALHLELTNLGVSSFDAFPFVEVATGAEEAREAFSVQQDISRAFVISADDMPALNLASALKRDRPDALVYVVRDERGTWWNQRCQRAGIDECLSQAEFSRELLRPFMGVRVCAESAEENLLEKVEPLEVESNRVLDVGKRSEGRAFFVPIVSACGGAGKSTLAYLTALAAARFGYKTLLVDLDAQLGDLDLFVADENPIRIDAVLADPNCAERLEAGEEGFAFVAACGSPECAENVFSQLDTVVDAVCKHFDVVIANCPAGWTDMHMSLLERAAKILFVLDQRPTAIRAAQRAFDLCLRCGLAASPFLFAVNKCGRNTPITSLEVGCSLKGAAALELPDGGREVAECLAARQGKDLMEEENPLFCKLESGLKDILPQCSVLKGVRREPKMLFPFATLFKKRG